MKEFIENTLHLKVSIKETDKYYNDLPLVYKSRYTIYDVKINTISFIAIEPKKEINLRMLAGQRKLVEEQVRLTCVIFLDTSTAYKKESFIEKGVPFVIKGKQIYLPFLGIALENERNKEISPITLISFLTQKMIFVAMYEKWRNITATEAAKKLGVTRMSANRCFDEIQYLGIKILDMKGKSRVISIPDDIETLWDNIKEKLRSPVIRTYALHDDIKLDKLGGISALCEYSMLQDNNYPTYVITKKEIADSGIKNMRPVYSGENIGCLVLEVGYFINFNNNNVEDPFSVILSLSEEDLDDPRVDLSIRKMLKEYVWLME